MKMKTKSREFMGVKPQPNMYSERQTRISGLLAARFSSLPSSITPNNRADFVRSLNEGCSKKTRVNVSHTIYEESEEELSTEVAPKWEKVGNSAFLRSKTCNHLRWSLQENAARQIIFKGYTPLSGRSLDTVPVLFSYEDWDSGKTVRDTGCYGETRSAPSTFTRPDGPKTFKFLDHPQTSYSVVLKPVYGSEYNRQAMRTQLELARRGVESVMSSYEDPRSWAGQFVRESFDDFKSSWDLNRRLEPQTLLWSNVVQLLPFGRLLSLKTVVRGICESIRSLPREIRKKPFSTITKLAVSGDLFYRFEVLTSIHDLRATFEAIDSVAKAFSIAISENNREFSEYKRSYQLFNCAPDVTTVPGVQWKIADPVNGSTVVKNTLFERTQYPNNADIPPYVTTGEEYPAADPNLMDMYWKEIPADSLEVTFQQQLRVRYKHLENLSPLKLWGKAIGAYNTWSAVWDLLPLSFLLDYFWRVGDAIETFENNRHMFDELHGEVAAAGPLTQQFKCWMGTCLVPRNHTDPGHLGTCHVQDLYTDKDFTNSDFGYGIIPGGISVSSFTRRRYTEKPGHDALSSGSYASLLSEENLTSTQRRTLLEMGYVLGQRPIGTRIMRLRKKLLPTPKIVKLDLNTPAALNRNDSILVRKADGIVHHSLNKEESLEAFAARVHRIMKN